MRPLRELAAEAIGLAGAALRERGGDGALEQAERILREGNGADRMRAAHAAGGMRAVLRAARRRGGSRPSEARGAGRTASAIASTRDDDAPSISAITCSGSQLCVRRRARASC